MFIKIFYFFPFIASLILIGVLLFRKNFSKKGDLIWAIIFAVLMLGQAILYCNII